MNFKLRVSKVLVTGGGSGIGEAIAEALVREGADCVICGRNIDKLKKVQKKINSKKLHIMEWDVKAVAFTNEKINEAACLCGGFLDGVVNNAGIYASTGGWTPWNETEDIWDNVWDTNLKAPIFIARRAATYFNNNKIKGNILNVSSIAAKHDIIGSYSGSKSALIEFTRGMAKQVASLGIVINGIAPGIVNETGINPGETSAQKMQAIQRDIKPKEIAEIALFLLSEAAQIIIGDTILADGGFYGAK